MRSILILISVFSFTTAQAQFDINEHLKKKQADRTKKPGQKISVDPLAKINQFKSLTLPSKAKTHILINGDKVIINPQYNMPVLVTDINRFKIMPNPGEDYFAKNFYVPGQQRFNDIPNGAAELPLPKKLQELINKSKDR